MSLVTSLVLAGFNLCLCYLVLVPIILTAEEPITITGNRMEVQKKGEVVFFQGNARLVQSSSTISADEIWEYKKEKKVEARGKVRFTDHSEPQEKVEALGDTLVYYEETGLARINGEEARFTRISLKKPQESITLKCKEIEIFRQDRRAVARHKVEIEQEGFKGSCETAEYNPQEKKMVLTGHPIIYQNTENTSAEYKGDTVIIYPEQERLVVEGNVMATLTPLEKKKG